MKKNLLKIMVLALALVIVAALAAGCGGGNKTPDRVPQTSETDPAPTGTQAPPVSEPQREPGVYFITVLPSANGTVTASCTQARAGDEITLTVTADEGYELLALTVNGVESELKFQMPAEDVSVLGRFGLPEEKEENKDDGETVKVYPNGKFFGSAGNYHSSDVLNMKTDSGSNPYLVMNAKKATPLYAYVKGFTGKQFKLEMTVKVTGIRSDEKYPKFGLMINDGKEMVKFYLDMNTKLQVSGVGAVHQKSGKQDNWAGQSTWLLQKKLDMTQQTVKLTLLRDGKAYYFYVNGQLVAVGDDLSTRNAAAGIFSFGTSMKVTQYTLTKAGSKLNAQLAQAQEDVIAFGNASMTENFFSKTEGAYTLTTDSDAQHKVDDVVVAGQVMREKFYSLKGKLTLTEAGDWGQARVLVSGDAKNEYFIALEKTNSGKFQIFTMSKANEEDWNDWQLIESAELNGTGNSIDFEVIVNGDKLYFLIDDQIYYSSNRVSMTKSTVKFTGFNAATTIVENLSLQVFANSDAVAEYISGKTEKAYASQFQGRMDDLYKEYITENGCTGKGGTLILGDSNMDFWGAWETQSGLTKYVNGYNVGIGGSTTKDWIHAYEQLIKPFNADRFVILVGSNDVNVWGRSGEETVASLKTLLEMIHEDHPDAEIYYIYTTPSPNAYADGSYSGKLAALVSGAKTLCEGLDYVQGIDVFDALTTADGKNSKEELFAEDRVHMNEQGYRVFSDILYEEIFRGENFGAAEGHKTTNGIELSKDKGDNASIEIFGLAPRYAYLNKVYTDKFSFEAQFNVSQVLNGDNYPKFGLLINGQSEMVKFFVDMTAEKTASRVGVVYQPTGGGDDWGGSVSTDVSGMSFTGSDSVKLKLVRDGKAYYFYVNGKLALYNENGFKAEKGAVGIFSFNAALTANNYSVAVGSDADASIKQAENDLAFLSKVGLTTNFFKEEPQNIYTLTTDSDAGHKVDDLRVGNTVAKAANYSVKGKLTLTNAGDWGQARILVSADGKNEYVFALEKTNTGKFQLFTMAKINEDGFGHWELILHQDSNGNRNSLNFEIVVIGNKLHLLVDNSVIYMADKVNMTESTVKFTGMNVATTTVESLALEIFDDANGANSYLNGKDFRVGQTFGIADGRYYTTNGISLGNDKGTNPTISVTGGAPQYAYANKVYHDKVVFEAKFNVSAVLNNDGYPKFGLLVNGNSEMVKFFVDMTSEKTASKVGVVYQPTGGGDDWGGSVSTDVSGMSFTGSDTVKLKLVRDGKAYYFYVNDKLALYNENGCKAENGAVGFFSFNAALTASNYSVAVGSDANSAIQAAKDTVAAMNKIAMTTNYFTESAGVYQITTDSDAQHKVDDLTKGGSVLRTAYYSVKGKLTLTNAGDWGQGRILISVDARNEYFFALEKTNTGKFQFFTMSKANQDDWDRWELILNQDTNGSRNSLDFEVVVIGSKVYFLVDNAVVYTTERVSMTQSTVKFTGFNVGTTTVENLSATVFENQQKAEAYISAK